MIPAVVVEPLPSWDAAEIARPALSEGSGAAFSSWDAWRSKGDSRALVAGCVATPIPGWVEEMRPSVVVRITGILLAAAERIVSKPVVVTREIDDVLQLGAADAPRGSAPVAVARRFITFGDPSVDDARGKLFACFIVCAEALDAAGTAPERSACAAIVAAAELRGSAPPPPPGFALEAIAWFVHHARRTAIVCGVAMAVAGLLAIVTRRKPRARISG
ncbi:MAG: hypothetical protein FWD69_05690 [Polyangiaceae bacterium]|nr:hypothetical protein [Polyangiaceae bacterium]